MRILAVNVRAGGSRSLVEGLAARCLGHEPDAVVISEYRENPSGLALRARFEAAGLRHQAGPEQHRGNAVLVAAREAFVALSNPFGLDDTEYPNAVVQARFGRLQLFGVYLPGQDRKRVHLRCFIALARRYNEQGIKALAIGDFNSGRNATDIELNAGRTGLLDEFSTADLYAELEQHWTEAWLHEHPGRLEFSWYPYRKVPPRSRRNGWRIDKAFVSQALLPDLRRAEYDHGFRTEGLTDHSALIVDLARGKA
jgi:exodeoxyribonuclease III